jgi:cellulose biosynthesis protein BcsE
MNESLRVPALLPNVRLGVRGLPTLTNSLVAGGLYVLIAETASARFPLLSSSLGTALNDGRQCTVVVPGNPEQFIQRLEGQGDLKLQQALVNGKCRMFEAQAEFPKKMFRYGADGFVQELEHFGVGEHGYLIFDQADDLISLHDMGMALEQIEILSQWLRDHQVTALLIFLRLTDVHAANLNALMDNLSGIAHLGSDEEGLRLSFDYWQSPEGAVVGRHHALGTLDTGLYEVIQRAGAMVESTGGGSTGMGVGSQAVPRPTDEPPSYFYMDPELGSLASTMPGHWQQVDSLVGMMHATRQHRAPIVIFCYRPDTALRLLTEAVHTLRVNLGPYAQLIVQEKDASLRYQNEALLLRLGLNLVIHRDVSTPRIPLLLGSLAGQMFNRNVDIDFEAALSSVMPSRVRGYQAPVSFVREVRLLLDRSAMLNIPFVLLVGLPAQGQAMLDVLSLMKLSRGGDLVTADTHNCYVFLHACQQAVALTAMERILGTSVDEVFESMAFQVTREDVERSLDGLLHNAGTGMALDYTAQLPPQQIVAHAAATGPASVSSFAPAVRATAPAMQTPSRPVGTSSAPTGTMATQAPARARSSAGSASSGTASPAADATPTGLHDPRLGAQPSVPVSGEADTPYRQGKPAAAVYGREAAPRAQRKSPTSTTER